MQQRLDSLMKKTRALLAEGKAEKAGAAAEEVLVTMTIMTTMPILQERNNTHVLPELIGRLYLPTSPKSAH
eukprot:846162-Prorocentrum_minimum.AAC.1